jgi:hypothetical protein
VSARYWVLISDELLARGIAWPDGLRFASPPVLPSQGTDVITEPHELPGMTWRLIQDDDAPAELEGCRVELVFRSESGRPVLAERRAAS